MLLVVARAIKPIPQFKLHHPLSIITSRRFQSTKSDEVADKVSSLIPNKNSIFVISIPITTSKSYIYCNHRPSTLSPKQLANIPFIYKLEGKFVKLASKGWSKLSNSKQKSIRKLLIWLNDYWLLFHMKKIV